MIEHPFLAPSPNIPWPELTPDRIHPDISEAIRRAEAELKQLLERTPESLDYENSFGAFDHLARLVGDPWGLVSHLESVLNTPEFRPEFKRTQAEVTRFFSSLPLNAELWAQLKAFGESEAVSGLDPIRRRHVEEVMAEFRESGADLPADKKARVLEIEEELARLTSQFSDHSLDSLNAFELLVTAEADLAGLPESARAAARESAREKGHGSEEQPVWRFTLHGPSFLAFMRYADKRELRQRMHQAYYELASADPHDNEPLILRIVALRAEKAALLGRNDFADLVLARRMAGKGSTALRFVEDLHGRVRDHFRREAQELEAFRREKTGLEGPLEAWDVAYWSEKLQQERYAFDEEALRPYFSVDRVIAGLFELTETLFGVRVRERTGDEKPPVWHPEVRVYDIVDSESGRLCGSFYTDWYPRETKRSGAWMTPMISGDGQRPHLGSMAGNLTRPVGDRPALLLHREVETIFHEFGHLLHHLLSEVPVSALGGTDVAWDFVELPSQIMENWCWERESLDRFARHHETDEPIPEELFQNLLRTRTFRTASFMVRQLSFGRTDLLLHTRFDDLGERGLEDWWREVNEEYLIPTQSPQRSNLRTFGHLFSDSVGYAAGYYSYLWADVLASDAFSRFASEGVLNGQTGRAFREHVLSKGNSQPPQELYRAFMGREPDPEALLRVRGLA